jgi:hypothetical protein
VDNAGICGISFEQFEQPYYYNDFYKLAQTTLIMNNRVSRFPVDRYNDS